jgi:mannose-6-phosphate isomerase-like protein (cupin superfamily)
MFSDFIKKNSIPDFCQSSNKQNILKGWGSEDFIFHIPSEKTSQQLSSISTVKILNFLPDKKLSIHYHVEKSEFFYILDGEIFVEIFDLNNKIIYEFCMTSGDKIFVPKGTPHRMRCQNILDKCGARLLEVSTLDQSSDSYRILKGD